MLISVFKAWVVFANPTNFLTYTSDANKGIGIRLLATYWHFVDLLWLYLILFFTFS
jgi:cytochrome c oxidase subunit 3